MGDVAARRKWSDAHYAAIWRLHRAGYSQGEIAKRCKDGEAGVPAFEIPRRTIGDIIERLERNGNGAALNARATSRPRQRDAARRLFERITTPAPNPDCTCPEPRADPEDQHRPCAECGKPIDCVTWLRVTGPARLERYRAEGKARPAPQPHPATT